MPAPIHDMILLPCTRVLQCCWIRCMEKCQQIQSLELTKSHVNCMRSRCHDARHCGSSVAPRSTSCAAFLRFPLASFGDLPTKIRCCLDSVGSLRSCNQDRRGEMLEGSQWRNSSCHLRSNMALRSQSTRTSRAVELVLRVFSLRFQYIP